MPGANLTKVEARERAGTVGAPLRYRVGLDLTHGPERFMSQTTIEFASTGTIIGLRRTLGGWVARQLHRKPMIVPVVADVAVDVDQDRLR